MEHLNDATISMLLYFFSSVSMHTHISISRKTRAIDSEMIHNGCVISTFAVKFCYAYVILFLNGFTTINNSVCCFFALFLHKTYELEWIAWRKLYFIPITVCEAMSMPFSNSAIYLLIQSDHYDQYTMSICLCGFHSYWYNSKHHRHIEQIRMNVIAHKIWQQR